MFARTTAALLLPLVVLHGVVAHGTALAAEPAAPALAPARNVALDFFFAAGTTAALSPLVLTGSRALGQATPTLLTSALPALLVAVAAPPAVATAAVAHRRRKDDVPTRLWPVYLAALGTQLLLYSGFVAAGGWVKREKDLLGLSLAQGILVGTAATVAAEVSF
ncbi:MAG: hypothetical protein IPG50_24305 [Myxococcales bacterium]|nr:hypothetical protein [Myxococcales bacterium]